MVEDNFAGSAIMYNKGRVCFGQTDIWTGSGNTGEPKMVVTEDYDSFF